MTFTVRWFYSLWIVISYNIVLILTKRKKILWKRKVIMKEKIWPKKKRRKNENSILPKKKFFSFEKIKALVQQEKKRKQKQKNKKKQTCHKSQWPTVICGNVLDWNARVDKGTPLLRWFGESNLVSIVLTAATSTSSIYLLHRQARRTLKNEET